MNDVCGNGGSWPERASVLPVAFAQVREDALLDYEIVRSVGEGARVAMVASGGCTVAMLASMASVAHLHCVDPNPAQLALTRLKLRLLATTGPGERLALLGHAPMAHLDRAARLTDELTALDLRSDVLGSISLVSRIGPDHAGRFEFLFAALREALHGRMAPIDALLSLGDPARQAERVAPQTNLGQCIDQALGDVMQRSSLVRLFGEAAVRNPAAPKVQPPGRIPAGRFESITAMTTYTTFQEFLRRIGSEVDTLDELDLSPAVRAFNSILTTACVLDELEVGVACMGIIERAFAGVSATIGRAVVERGWLRRDRLIHYSLHAEIDVRHADEFFAVVEPAWEDEGRRYLIDQGLQLGAYALDRLYRDLHLQGIAAENG